MLQVNHDIDYSIKEVLMKISGEKDAAVGIELWNNMVRGLKMSERLPSVFHSKKKLQWEWV